TAPWFDIREQQHSPGLLLVLQTMKQADEWGLKRFDLTMGEGDLKERFSTSRADLPTIVLYSRRLHYLGRRLRDHAVKAVRRVLAALRGEDLWKQRVKPVLLNTARHLHVAASVGPVQGYRYVCEMALSPLACRTQLLA